MIKFNKENLELVSDIIMDHLTFDLLPKRWHVRNCHNPTFGHCHTASGVLYKIFTHKQLHMYRGHDGEIYHWWCQDNEDNIIDLTSDQYTSVDRTPPYDAGERYGMLGFDYRKRVNTLLEQVQTDPRYLQIDQGDTNG